MPRPWPLLTGLSLACLAAACEATVETPDFVQIDSAGTTILESFRPAWDEGNGWTVLPDPELAIGAGPTGGDDPNHPPFGFIRDVSVLSNGDLVVGDISTSEVMVFDTLGQLAHRFGGQGEGPGELADFGAVRTCGGDTIIAADPYAFNFFDPQGRFIRRLATVDGRTRTPLNVLVISADCQRFLVTGDRYWTQAPEDEEGLIHWVLAWTDDSFTGLDTVVRAPALHVYQDGAFTRIVPWTANVRPIRWAGDDLVLAYSQRAELQVVSPTGELKRILRWHATPDPVTTEDRRRWNEEQGVGESGRRVQLGDFPWVSEHKAFFDDQMADDEGNIWARILPPRDPSPERWTVLNSAGRWLGVVQMPDGFSLSQIARGRVYGVHRTESGVPTARVYRLDQGG